MTIFIRTVSLFGFIFLSAFAQSKDCCAINKPEAIAKAIMDQLQPYILDFDIDKTSAGIKINHRLRYTGKEEIILRFTKQIAGNKPIRFYILAFPFKSANLDKTDSCNTPDMADYHSLVYLGHQIKKLRKIYSKVSLTVITDGALFALFFGISSQEVDTFESKLESLVDTIEGINLIKFSDVLNSRNQTLNEFISHAEHTPIHIPEKKLRVLRNRLRAEIDHKDHSFSKLHLRNQIEHLRDISQRFVERDHYLRKAIREFIPDDGIRLSAHFQCNISKKIGIKLSPYSKEFPWNGVLFITHEGKQIILPKNRINLQKATPMIKTVNGVELKYYLEL